MLTNIYSSMTTIAATVICQLDSTLANSINLAVMTLT